jgi:hypothetical protein
MHSDHKLNSCREKSSLFCPQLVVTFISIIFDIVLGDEGDVQVEDL